MPGAARRARRRGRAARRSTTATDELLTSREREVLVLLAEGRTNREIAAALSVTLATVKSHLVRIYAKLEADNRNEALGRAVALGPAPLDRRSDRASAVTPASRAGSLASTGRDS